MTNINKIKNIIFDLGGVIMNLDVSKTIKSFENIGITDIVNKTGHHYKDSVFYDFEIGKVSEIGFIERLLGMSNLTILNKDIKEAWNAMILEMPKERIELLLDLKKEYRIFLLSNTNSIHQEKFLTEFKNEYSFDFSELFEKTYYSHEIGMRKPDEKTFKYVLKDSNLNPCKTLFVDDAIDNVKIAQKVGIKTFHIKNYNVLDITYIIE